MHNKICYVPTMSLGSRNAACGQGFPETAATGQKS